MSWVIGRAQGRWQLEEGTGECWLHPAGEVLLLCRACGESSVHAVLAGSMVRAGFGESPQH